MPHPSFQTNLNFKAFKSNTNTEKLFYYTFTVLSSDINNIV